jgi:hypothetical protein
MEILEHLVDPEAAIKKALSLLIFIYICILILKLNKINPENKYAKQNKISASQMLH